MAGNEEEKTGAGLTCSICGSGFDIESEGGIEGLFGILPVAFCPWCYSAMIDMVSQGCHRCIEAEDDDPSIN